MGVYIKGKMPKDCLKCPFCLFADGCWKCLVDGSHADFGGTCRPSLCPLIEVPTPHGRLIDADEFDERIRQAGGMCEEELTKDFKDGVQTVLAMLKTQTTIIPAEEGET